MTTEELRDAYLVAWNNMCEMVPPHPEDYREERFNKNDAINAVELLGFDPEALKDATVEICMHKYRYLPLPIVELLIGALKDGQMWAARIAFEGLLKYPEPPNG